jgi:hypothetical protein
MTQAATIAAGLYRHYKGQEYEVERVVRHSETEESLVIYRCLYGDFSWWARPLAMFQETVVVDGVSVPRFLHIGPVAAAQPTAPARGG